MIKKQTHENDENVLNDLEKEIREVEELLEDLPFHNPINKTEKKTLLVKEIRLEF